MAGYSPEEIAAAVQSVVGTSTRPGRDAFGSRVQAPVFAAYQQNIASVFLLNSDAPYYLFWITAQRLQETVQDIVDDLNELVDNINLTARASVPVSDLTPLGEARSALIELEQAVTSRKTSFQDIEKVPAFRRMDTNIASFLSANGSNVRYGGSLVISPDVARQKIRESVPQLKERLEACIEQVAILRDAGTTLESLELPTAAATAIIGKARVLVESVTSELETADQAGRLDLLRDSVVQLMAVKSAVKLYGNFTAKRSALFVAGIGRDFADATHPAVPARVVATIPGPYAVAPGHQHLDAWLSSTVLPQVTGTAGLTKINDDTIQLVDGLANFPSQQINVGAVVYFNAGPLEDTRWYVQSAAPTTLVLAGRATGAIPGTAAYEAWSRPDASVALASSQIPLVQSTRYDEYDFHDASGGIPYNRTFKFSVTNDGAQEDGEVTFPVNAATTSYEAAAAIQAVITPSMNLKATTFFANLKYTGRGDITDIGGGDFRFTPYSTFPSYVANADIVYIVDGPDAGVTGTNTSFSSAVDFTPSAALTPSTNVKVEIGLKRGVQLSAADSYGAILARQAIAIPRDDASNESTYTLGLRFGTSYTKPAQADAVARQLSSLTTTLVGGVVDEVTWAGSARTVPAFPSDVVLFRSRGTAAVTNDGVLLQIAWEGAAEVGDKVIFSQAPVIDEVWTVTAILNGVLTASGGTVFTSPAAVFDLGPDQSAAVAGATFRVAAGVNAGSYVVTAAVSPLRLTILGIIAQSLSPTSLSFEFSGELLMQYLSVSVKDTLLTSAITMKGSLLPEMFALALVRGRYTTPYFQLPSLPNALKVGDRLDYHDTDYQVSSLSRSVLSIDSALRVLRLDATSGEPFSPDYTFSEEVIPPFARLRPKDVNDYGALREELSDWLARAQIANLAVFFQNLAGKLNILLQRRGTTTELAAAIQEVQTLRDSLNGSDSLLTALQGYQASSVDILDTALNALKEKGMKRAFDIIVTSDLKAFFGLTEQTSTYAGALLTAARDVAVGDLPIRKQERTDLGGPALSSTASTDYENSTEDSDGVGLPQAPSA